MTPVDYFELCSPTVLPSVSRMMPIHPGSPILNFGCRIFPPAFSTRPKTASSFICDEHPEIDVLSPESIGGSPVMIVVDVEDVGALFPGYSCRCSSGETVGRCVQRCPSERQVGESLQAP